MKPEDALLAVSLSLVGLSAAALIFLRWAPERWLRWLDGDPTEVQP